jgi:uncharacterized damage-inducible protein DinB
MLAEHVQRQAANNVWSNLRLRRAWSCLTAEEFASKRTNFFPSIQATVQHILEVDLYYLDALEGGGEGLAVFDRPLPLSQSDLAGAQRAADDRLTTFCASLDDSDLTDVRTLQRPDGDKTETVVAILSHLFVHQIHHRGQIHAKLAGTDVTPPQLDEFFLRQDCALRAAEMTELGITDD